MHINHVIIRRLSLFEYPELSFQRALAHAQPTMRYGASHVMREIPFFIHSACHCFQHNERSHDANVRAGCQKRLKNLASSMNCFCTICTITNHALPSIDGNLTPKVCGTSIKIGLFRPNEALVGAFKFISNSVAAKMMMRAKHFTYT